MLTYRALRGLRGVIWHKQHFGNPELQAAALADLQSYTFLHKPGTSSQPSSLSAANLSPEGPGGEQEGFQQGLLGVKKTTWKMLTTCSNEANRFTAEVQMQFNWSIKFHIFHNSRWTNKTCFWLLTELPGKEVRTWEPQTRTRLVFHILFLIWLTHQKLDLAEAPAVLLIWKSVFWIWRLRNICSWRLLQSSSA